MDIFLLVVAVALLGYTSYSNKRLESKMSEAQDAVDAVVAQLTKVQTEVVTVRDALNARIDELEAREPNVDVGPLREVAQSLDDLTPDA